MHYRKALVLYRHIDLWDAVENQNFFSFEAFQHVLAQLSNTQRQPDIPTPYYKTLRKYKEFEIRGSALASCSPCSDS